MRNVSGKVAEKIKTHLSLSVTSVFNSRVVFEKMWKNFIGSGKTQIKIWHIHIACWIPTATNTHSEHVIFIDFPLQSWLHEHTSVICYMYNAACLVHCRCHFLDLFLSNRFCCKWKPCGIKFKIYR
jgi:hypothetical protein